MKEQEKAFGAAAPRTACPRCTERGKTWLGDSPICAFPAFAERGGEAEFAVANWNCAAMNGLRELADADGAAREYSEDQYAALLPGDGAFLVLGWYKRRGRTEYAGMLSGETVTPLTYGDADRILTASKASARQRHQTQPSDSKG